MGLDVRIRSERVEDTPLSSRSSVHSARYDRQKESSLGTVALLTCYNYAYPYYNFPSRQPKVTLGSTIKSSIGIPTFKFPVI